jgi:hypothetical protein
MAFRDKFLAELIKPSHYDDQGLHHSMVARLRPVGLAFMPVGARTKWFDLEGRETVRLGNRLWQNKRPPACTPFQGRQ